MEDILSLIHSLDAPNGHTRQGELLMAILFAAEKHKNQFRKGINKVPYINHPIAVMKLVNLSGIVHEGILAAAVLHDTVEDTNTTVDELRSTFGNFIAECVKEVTDDKSLSKLQRKKDQIEHARNASDVAKLIKIADKISNLLDVCNAPPPSWTLLDAQGYACWSSKVVEACVVEDSIPNAWLTNSFLTVLYKGTFTLPDGQKVPILPANEEQCLADYYASLF